MSFQAGLITMAISAPDARLVDVWVTGVGLMRSEYGALIENTVRYLGIDVEDALTLAENTEI
jgi:hypothetical protein